MTHVAETESLRFGNGGTTPSYEKWRLPALIGDRLFCFWVSVVPVQVLGLLLGRDALEALGVTLDFEERTLNCRRLGLMGLRLEQMKAGHFMLPLLPLDQKKGWGDEPANKFRRFGQDGVIELPLTHRQWLANMIGSRPSHPKHAQQEHLLTESGVESAMVNLFRSFDSASPLPPRPELQPLHNPPVSGNRLLMENARTYGALTLNRRLLQWRRMWLRITARAA